MNPNVLVAIPGNEVVASLALRYLNGWVVKRNRFASDNVEIFAKEGDLGGFLPVNLPDIHPIQIIHIVEWDSRSEHMIGVILPVLDQDALLLGCHINHRKSDVQGAIPGKICLQIERIHALIDVIDLPCFLAWPLVGVGELLHYLKGGLENLSMQGAMGLEEAEADNKA